jgi:hypothetical protein
MSIEREFIPYEQALALKELGFDEPCLAQYKKYDVGEATLDIGFSKNEIIMQFHKLSKFCSAPLYQQAFRWFREKYNLWNMIYPRDGWNYSINRVDETTSCSGESFHSVEINEYEEAELECLKKLIEIVKEK